MNSDGQFVSAESVSAVINPSRPSPLRATRLYPESSPRRSEGGEGWAPMNTRKTGTGVSAPSVPTDKIKPWSSRSLRLCGEQSFVPSRATSSVFGLVEVDGGRMESKSKTQRGNTNRKTTSGRSHGLVQQRIASTLRTRSLTRSNQRSLRVLRSKLCLNVRRRGCHLVS
jgi:hypothetical protein